MKILAAVFFGVVSIAGASETDWLGGANPAATLHAAAALRTAAVNRPAPGQGQSLPNFAQVSPVLYRSGQPTQQGVAQLQAQGIKTILKLNFDSPAESSWAAGAGVALVTQLMDNRSSPTYDQVDAALAVINDPARQPVLVHCHRGADRTGAVVAAYRAVVQGMGMDQAVAEAKSFGYGAPGFSELKTWLTGYVAHRSGH